MPLPQLPSPTTLSVVAAVVAVFFVSDLIYTLDHYFVHHDKARYRQTHAKHHIRYGGVKRGRHLDRYELRTYGTAALMSAMPASVLTLFTGNVGFLLGVALKFLHTLLLHLYQHRWWGPTNLRKQRLGRPRGGWGLASAAYHAFHHSDPDERPFTYAESWKGFDRLLELAHPWLVRFTVDGKRRAELRAGSSEISGDQPAL